MNLFTTLHADTQPPCHTNISIPCGVLLLFFISSIKFTASNYRYSLPTPCRHGWNENSEKQIKRWLSVSLYILYIISLYIYIYIYTYSLVCICIRLLSEIYVKIIFPDPFTTQSIKYLYLLCCSPRGVHEPLLNCK